MTGDKPTHRETGLEESKLWSGWRTHFAAGWAKSVWSVDHWDEQWHRLQSVGPLTTQTGNLWPRIGEIDADANINSILNC
jgi:hypothetical protein